jgi:large subunit ribosomal protein L17
MRHRISFRKLSRTHEHRRALLRNLVTSLFIHERIATTVAKAKEARRVAERMITFAKRGDLSARRHVDSYLFYESATKKLFDTIAPWYKERAGGYTRIIRKGRRLGDAGEIAIFELVKSDEQKAGDRQRRLEAAEAKDAAKAEGAKKAAKKGEEDDAEAGEGEEAPKAKGKGKAAAKKAAPKKAAAGAGRKSAGTGGATKTTAKPGRTKRGGD